MYRFNYTCEVIDPTGKVLHFIPTDGYFTSIELLVYWLGKWTGCNGPNGSTYHYYITGAQNQTNGFAELLTIEELPLFRVGYYGRQSHEYDWLYDLKDKWRESDLMRGLFNPGRLAPQ